MKISAVGLAIVKAFESCLKPDKPGYFAPYYCPSHVLTIGWGHTNDNGRKFSTSDRWSQAECDAELYADMAVFEKAVERRVTVTLNQNQFDALVSFTFNCGEGNLAKSSLLRKVNAGDFDGAVTEFPKWNKGDGVVLAGLVRRRKSEAALFAGKVNDALATAGAHKLSPVPMPQKVDPPVAKKISATKTGAAATGGSGATVALHQAGFPLHWAIAIGVAVAVVAFIVLHRKG